MSLILEAFTIGSLIYLIKMTYNRVKRPPVQVDMVMFPFSEKMLQRDDVTQPFYKDNSDPLVKDKDEITEAETPEDIKLEMLERIQDEYTTPPDPYYGREGIYTTEYNLYSPLNEDP